MIYSRCDRLGGDRALAEPLVRTPVSFRALALTAAAAGGGGGGSSSIEHTRQPGKCGVTAHPWLIRSNSECAPFSEERCWRPIASGPPSDQITIQASSAFPPSHDSARLPEDSVIRRREESFCPPPPAAPPNPTVRLWAFREAARGPPSGARAEKLKVFGV
jgi:hypothetical protein